MAEPGVPGFRGAASVRVPATCANLGPGFDAFGLALDLVDDVRARVTPEGLDVEVSGEGAGIACDETHLVVRAMRATFERLGAQPPGLELECRNRIPHSRGLGSSAAAIVAGVWLARGLVTDGAQRLDDAAALGLAAAIEGHPDNVAACVLGGLTVAWSGPDGARAITRAVTADVRPLVLIPPFTTSTEQARGLLPATVPHGDAAFNSGRAALLVATLTAPPGLSTPEQLFAATEDRLHQSFREPAMPDTYALVQRLRAVGLAAVVSGAGPTVLVLAASPAQVTAAVYEAPAGWTARPSTVAAGVRLTTGDDAPSG